MDGLDISDKRRKEIRKLGNMEFVSLCDMQKSLHFGVCHGIIRQTVQHPLSIPCPRHVTQFVFRIVITSLLFKLESWNHWPDPLVRLLLSFCAGLGSSCPLLSAETEALPKSHPAGLSPVGSYRSDIRL